MDQSTNCRECPVGLRLWEMTVTRTGKLLLLFSPLPLPTASSVLQRLTMPASIYYLKDPHRQANLTSWASNKKNPVEKLNHIYSSKKGWGLYDCNQDKKRQGRRKRKPSPFGMRELLTLTAACEIAALGRATQLQHWALDRRIPAVLPARWFYSPLWHANTPPACPAVYQTSHLTKEVVTDNQKAGAA